MLTEYNSPSSTVNSGERHSDREIRIDKLRNVIRYGFKTMKFWDRAIRSEIM